jgi:hypothetical protein
MTLIHYDMSQPEEPKQGRAWAFLAGALAGALVLAIAWWGATALPPDDQAGGPPRGEETPSGTVGPSASALSGEEAASGETAVDTMMSRCREVFAVQETGLAASAHSLDQWEVHIGAMNKLVTGAITLKQATQFWNQTRFGAASRLKRAAAARQRFGERTARCPKARDLASRSTEVRSCQQAVEARNRALRLATTSLATRKVHVHHMEMLRRGEMTPEDATRMWLQSWRTGDAQVRAYRNAAQEAEATGCCSGDPTCE